MPFAWPAAIMGRMHKSALAMVAILLAAGCGDTETDDGPEPDDDSFTCSSVPACFSDVLAVINSCRPTEPMTLFGTEASATCENATSRVFFDSLTPTRASVKTVTGVDSIDCVDMTNEPGSNGGRQYELRDYALPSNVVEVSLTDEIVITCSDGVARSASVSSLSGCADQVVLPEIIATGNDITATAIDMELRPLGNPPGASYFVCSGMAGQ